MSIIEFKSTQTEYAFSTYSVGIWNVHLSLDIGRKWYY
jgi:hypothetical protein